MAETIKRQIIKALAYGKTHEEIKECACVSDDDINSITAKEIEAEKDY